MKNQSLGVLLLTLCLLLTGCAGVPSNARTRLDGMLSLLPTRPAGRVYGSHASEWESEALPPLIAQNLYQSGDGVSAFSLSDEYAVFFATGREGGEIAVFVAAEREARERIGSICAARLSLLRTTLPGEQEGCVIYDGDAVILLFLSGAEEIRHALL